VDLVEKIATNGCAGGGAKGHIVHEFDPGGGEFKSNGGNACDQGDHKK
jgi:hypothetical protein